MMSKQAVVAVIVFLASYSCARAALDLTGWNEVDPSGRWNYSNPTSQQGRLDEIAVSSTVGPCWVVSDFELAATADFSLTIDVAGGTDDDFFGFAFGYKDNSHFFLVDWKRASQSLDWGDAVPTDDDVAEAGIKLKKVDGGWTSDGLWGGEDGLGVSTLAGAVPYGDQWGWLRNTPYTFDVHLTPGHVTVALDGKALFDVADESLQGGAIALYGFSEDNIVFSNVVPEPSTCLLFGLGALGAFLTRKRR
jgi:hypothetical protein